MHSLTVSLRKKLLKLLLTVVDEWRSARGIKRILILFIISVFLVEGGLIVYATGGTKFDYTHVMYVPILLAAFMFRVPGGLIAGVLAGLIVGPIMPLDVNVGAPQPTLGWIYRMGFFTLIGVIAGALASLLNLRLNAIERLTETISTTYARTLKSLALVVEARDEPTGGHCERVAQNAYAVGKALGLDQKSLEALHWAGLLHDFGKIAVPEHILLKQGKLTQEEYEEVRRHAAFGAEILNSISPDFNLVAQAVRSHHERWDGSGYPDGLDGESIPITGRILGVVDVFEALTSARPYRDPMPVEEALTYLREHAGSHFDPSIVPVFEDLYRRGEIYVSGAPESAIEFRVPITFNKKIIYQRSRELQKDHQS